MNLFTLLTSVLLLTLTMNVQAQLPVFDNNNKPSLSLYGSGEPIVLIMDEEMNIPAGSYTVKISGPFGYFQKPLQLDDNSSVTFSGIRNGGEPSFRVMNIK